MKKTVLLLSLLLIAGIASYAGDVISATKAREIAAQFFCAGQAPSSRKAAAQAAESLKFVKSSPKDAWHIFNREGGGFVIVSGDSAIGPYLAYSHDSSFKTEEMPENVALYLSDLEKEVLWYRSHPEAQPCYGSSAGANVSEVDLGTAKWNQTDPYNLLTPNNSVTGCVATAMAIVMRHNRWPEKGTGSLPGYTTYSKKYVIEGYDLGHTYDWDKMPLSGIFTSEEQKNQVAQLMLDCGVMVQMDYTSKVSGAYTEDIIPAMTEYMGYDKSAKLMIREAYTKDAWFEIIKEQIDADHPVLYGGNSEDGGHQFVVDGYNSSKEVHINFGWGGSGDGFYMLTDMGGFTSYNDLIINIKKDEGGVYEPYYMMSLYRGGIELDGAYKKDQPFTIITTGWLVSASQDTFNGEVAVGVDDYYGNFSAIISDRLECEDLGYMYGFEGADFTCTAGSVRPGRRVQLYFRPDGQEEWTPCGHTDDVTWFLYPAGEDIDFEQYTDITFDKSTSILTVILPIDDVEYSFKDASGRDVAVSASADGLTLTIDTKDLSGDCTLTLTRYEQVRTITIAL